MSAKEPSEHPRFRRTHTAAEIASCFGGLKPGSSSGTDAAVAGRIMAVRQHGRATFAALRDSTGDVQLFFSEGVMGEGHYSGVAELEVGDWIGATGEVVRTRKGELSVMPGQFVLLAKHLRPLPEKWHGLKDVETRYRQRYVDLMVNPEVRRVFELRSRVMERIRAFLIARGFLEVETPILQPLPGGAAARPFKTHHQALDMDLYLRIAPELYLKRLLVGGMEKVFELNRSFRNEGVSTKHNPEFTMLEVYEALSDYRGMMQLTFDLITDVAKNVTGGLTVTQQDGSVVDLAGPWSEQTLTELVSEAVGEAVSVQTPIERLCALCAEHDVPAAPGWGPGKLLTELFEKLVEGGLLAPTFVTHYPVEVTPLARRDPAQPLLAERFELIVGGCELANAFSELTDPVDQRRRFEEQALAAQDGDEDAHRVDEDYLRAMEYGMPPAGGLGIGVDRLVMLLAGVSSIRDVLLFPLLRPQAEKRG